MKATWVSPTIKWTSCLYLLVDQRYSNQDCVDAGFEESFVKKVVDRIRRNQFKRVSAAHCQVDQPDCWL